ncbi:hypothetical protein LB505_014042 [Fusarium chuoi]|nr:hypothetical protein LB505_014042 [Fusarium chuoi]
MPLPETYRSFRRTTGDLPRTIELSTEHVPTELGPNDVLIKIHAVSLNFRDVAMLNGRYPVEVEEQGIPCSDAAAEVVAIGSAVKELSTGDHVSVIFDLNNLTGSDDESHCSLGGDTAGVLREYAIYQDKHLVQLPKYLPWEEAATITCAGVTAWNSLDGLTTASKSRSALLQGTGGVSMFALLICVVAGIQPIITSSSDEKLEAVKKLGSKVRGINYKTTQDQASDPAAIMALMGKSARVKGIATGSKDDYLSLNKFLDEKKVSLAPLVDRVFSFEESPAAFDYLYSGQHVGKVIIKI